MITEIILFVFAQWFGSRDIPVIIEFVRESWNATDTKILESRLQCKLDSVSTE